MLDRSEVGKRGYLLENYRLFHLRDSRAQVLDYHYHVFSKLVLHLDGQVVYHIEGKSYSLQPMDILLVSRNLIHLPEIGSSVPYERMVLWLDAGFLERVGAPETNLNACFDETARRGVHLYRPRGEDRAYYREMFERIRRASEDTRFAAGLLADTCVIQLMIALNRDVLAAPPAEAEVTYRFDPKMEEVARYIAGHLQEDLSIDHLSRTFFLSRYYLMHRFKKVYGCTLHHYILQKRVQYAAGLLRQGAPVQKAAAEAGFGDYSAFLRTFRAAYGTTPRAWK